MEQILNLQHISYTYHTLEGETPALSDISFSLNKGEFAAIVGPSGCGKSTLLSLICGLLPCSDGQITINGRHLKESTTNVGYMLQHDELFEWRTIYNNVILGFRIVKKAICYCSYFYHLLIHLLLFFSGHFLYQ